MSVIYMDMDGVIADFFGGVQERYQVDHWKSIQHRDGIFVELRNTDFFNTLKIFPNTIELMDHIALTAWSNDMQWGICSSPLRGDRDNSAYWKRVWLQDHMFMPLVENCIFTSNKHNYAWNEVTHRPNILIDDKPENIKRWNEAGGIGIRFQANEDDLKEYLFVELEKAIEKIKHYNM